jgi:hypothetical protein
VVPGVISVPQEIPVGVPVGVTYVPRIIPKPEYPSYPKIASGFYPGPGFKFEGSGFSTPSTLRFQGVRSRRKKYPILTGEEALKIGTIGIKTERKKRK